MCENCPYCPTWGGREEGLEPLAYTEKTLFWIWPLEFVRHILEVHLHQTGSGTNSHRPFWPHKQRWRLTSTWSSWMHLESSRSRTKSGRSFTSERERAPQHSTCKMHCWGSSRGHPSASRHVLVEDLASICGKSPLRPSPFTLSWYTCPIARTRAFGTECESTWNERSWCTSASRRATVSAEVNKLEWKCKSELLIHCSMVKCTHHATTLNQSYKSGSLQPSGYSSPMVASFPYYN